ncbi:MAG: c-type cytochrome [Chloroflexota bacterium]
MNEKEKKDYRERYKQAKERGVPFFPDIVFKDAIASVVVFLILAALAYFLGVPTEPRADPNDASYTPRPEWYFLFLFQLLKYFPGRLEFIGAMLVPGVFIVLLLVLPFLDRNPKRHFLNRPWASAAALLVVGGITTLTVLSVREAPPPQIATPVDLAAELYTRNCANCHGPSITVPPATDLHQLIAEGKHEGMPAWGGDLSTDEIDALAGFITSPKGSALYARECAGCHRDLVLASGNPQELHRVLEEGGNYPPHLNQDVPNWEGTLTGAESNTLLNFLAAPDGQRLFEVNCSGCHGFGVKFTGGEDELHELISKGGQHLTMPAWQGTFSEADLDVLAAYVTDPAGRPAGDVLFGQHCSACHAASVPSAPDMVTARKVIRGGGAHVTMPVWGEILTPEQLDALVQFSLTAARGEGTQEGARLFAENCVACHGQFGQGGPNPTQVGDMIAPISSTEYLGTRDDVTLRNIISQGQPNLGMNPFGSAYGGALGDDEIEALVAYMRSWQANPPQFSPPEPPTATAPEPGFTAEQTYRGLCAQCHGARGEGGSGPALNTSVFQTRRDDQALADLISTGVPSTPMIGVGQLLSDRQINDLVSLLRTFGSAPVSAGAGPDGSKFSEDVLPTLRAKCQVCHNSSTQLGGWDASTYESVLGSGNNPPAVIPGDVDKSLLARLIQGIGGPMMPPGGALSSGAIQSILDWIAAGAMND